MFDSATVIAAFEQATGVHLELETYPELDSLKARGFLPAVENYASPKHANDRFGGHFCVRTYTGRDDPDVGVVDDDGLERYLPERGPQEYHVSASAQRANAEVMFWGNTGEITPEMETTWALLTSCLSRLEAARTPIPSTRTLSGTTVIALGAALVSAAALKRLITRSREIGLK